MFFACHLANFLLREQLGNGLKIIIQTFEQQINADSQILYDIF